MQRTSLAKIYKKFPQSGFSLIEVLAVIVLIGLMSTVGYRLINSQSGADKLDKFKDDLTRTINFAKSEAIIRNRVIRLVVHLNKTPQSSSLQMASTTQLLLPEKTAESVVNSPLDDEEKKKSEDKFNQNFLALPDSEAKEFSIDVQIVAVGHLESKELQFAEDSATEDFSTFFYPSGEKDPTLFIVKADNEVMALSYDGFRDRINTKYYPYETGEMKNFAEQIFKEWKP